VQALLPRAGGYVFVWASLNRLGLDDRRGAEKRDLGAAWMQEQRGFESWLRLRRAVTLGFMRERGTRARRRERDVSCDSREIRVILDVP
jgi:hypothetical protein